MELDLLWRCCINIKSSKVSERKKNADQLSQLLENKNVLALLNKNDSGKVSWDGVVKSVHSYLIMEGEKILEDENKKGTNPANRKHVGDLLNVAVGAANKRETRLDVLKLIQYVLDCFNHRSLKKYFSDKYLLILKDNILSQPSYHGQIDEQSWLSLWNLLKSFFEETSCDNVKVISCLHLLIKWGPMYQLSMVHLRNEFPFITQLGLQVKASSPKVHKLDVLKILVEFCNKNANDCCMACCKLGEEVFLNLQNLYETHTTDITIKELLFEFFLLQMKLHHPKGAAEENPSAYAFSWPNWKKYIRTIFFIVQKEFLSIETFKLNPLFNYLNSRRMRPIFAMLAVEVFKQVFSYDVDNITQISLHIPDETQPPTKRQRVEVGVPRIIRTIQETKSWQWINIMTDLLMKYPEIIKAEDFIQLLQLASNLQLECKNPDVQEHIYKCLQTLIDVEKYFGDIDDMQSTWCLVSDSALRSAGLNQNMQETHHLIQKLIMERKTQNASQLFQTYISGVLTTNKFSLKTLDVAAQNFNMPDTINKVPTKKAILNWILNNDEKCQNLDFYSEEITAQILVFLCLKQWPSTLSDTHNKCCNFDDFEDVYMFNTFQSIVLMADDTKPQEIGWKLYTANADLLEELILKLQALNSQFVVASTDDKFIKNLLSVTVLNANILSFMFKFKVIDSNKFEGLVRQLHIKKLFLVMSEILLKYSEEKSHSKLYFTLVTMFSDLLKIAVDDFISAKIREYIPVELLKCFFQFLKDNEDEDQIGRSNVQRDKLKLLCMEALTNFCFVKGSANISEIQTHALHTLTEPNYDAAKVTDYEMAISFMLSIKQCTPGILSDEILNMILTSLRHIFEVHRNKYETMLHVITILKDFFSHVNLCNCDIVKTQSLELLKEIYLVKDMYGPKVCMLLVECMGQIVQLDPGGNWSKWSNEYITFYIPDFLSSNYQGVRLTAVTNLSNIFKMSFPNEKLSHAIQKTIFDKLNMKCREVFTIEEVVNGERLIDETVTRTATVLHTYGAIMAVNSTWRKMSLFSVMQLVHIKKLNINLLEKLLDMVARYLGIKDLKTFIESHTEYLLNRWHSKKFLLREFPYILVGCSTDFEFYNKYVVVIVPILIQNGDLDAVAKISEDIGKSLQEVIELSFSKIVSNCLLKINNFNTNDERQRQSGKKVYEHLETVLSASKIKELLLNDIDLVVVQMIQSVIDLDLYKKQFNIDYELSNEDESHYSMVCLQETLDYMQKRLALHSPILEYCVENLPNKIQSIALNLALNLHSISGIDAKLKAMHQYAIFADIVTPFLKPEYKIKEFLLRDIVHVLLNLIDIHNGENLLNVALINYLQAFFSSVLPQCADILGKFLIVVINKLIPIVQSDCYLTKPCLTLLHFLIVDSEECFKESIKFLDPFPQNNNFRQINNVYLKVKYGNKSYTLKDEIEHFIQAGNLTGTVGCRTEALRHLKVQLSTKKGEVKELYEELKRDSFSKSSILHQLICSLLKLTCSPDSNVSEEATRCLGELGPVDLRTIILQTEKVITDDKSSPLQLLTSQVVNSLYKYIVDDDIRVVELSSKTLYKVLNTKEGKIFIDNCENHATGLNRKYLTPFLTKHKFKSDSQVEIKSRIFYNACKDDLWCSMAQHDSWVVKLVCGILECFSEKTYLKQIIPVCEVKVEFSEHILPYLIYIVLYQNISDYNENISNQMVKYFDKVWTLTSAGNNMHNIQKSSIRCMLDIVYFVRLQRSVAKKLGNLSLNYLKVAQAAYYCSDYCTALLYVELWCQLTITRLQNSGQCSSTDLSMLDMISASENKDTCLVLQTILRQSYTALGDFDALNGCGFTYLLDTKTRVDHDKQLGKWDQVLLHYDTQMHENHENAPQLMDALKNCGLYQLASHYNESSAEPDYECLWRLNKYNNGSYKTQQNTPDTYEKCNYEALKSLYENDDVSFLEAVAKARNVVVDSVRNTSLESMKNLYNSLMMLQSIQQLEDLHEAKQKNDFDNVLHKWKEQDMVGRYDFKYIEPIKSQRIAMLSNLVKAGVGELKNPLIDMYLDLADVSRSEGYFNIAKRAIGNLSLLPDLPAEYNGLKMFEEAQICWSMNDKSTARYIIRHLLNISGETIRLHYASLILYGKWMIESCSENPHTIITKYFFKSLEIMKTAEKSTEDYNNIFEAYDVLARFVDAEYQRILTYIKSTEFERKVHNMEKSKTNALKIKTQAGQRINTDEKRAIVIYEKQSMIDETEIENTRKEKETYFMMAMKYYMLHLKHSDVNNMRLFRVISLWLDNPSSPDLPKLIKENIMDIASYKFLPILPQLVPHLGSSKEEYFGKSICAIIERCAKEHPYHTLPILLALANSNKDDDYCNVTVQTESNEPRVIGASHLLTKLKNDCRLKKIISQMELLSDALIELAYVDHHDCSGSGTSFCIPDRSKINKIKNFSELLLPTYVLPVKKNNDYSNVIGIHSFAKKFANVGGINAPKRITCRGTDGLERTQLLKGKDDLRQDAVMQQVFTIMNELLHSNKNTTKLLIRTYKVIPLSKRSGLIEWVENSVPIGEYLTDAHKRYNTGDWKLDKCKRELTYVAKGTNAEKFAKFKEICRNFHPVMHKFFETNFPQPSVWYERRRAYMNSVATSSMIGYILGLGDRHVQNILLDKITAEVIHIDFGIAFEQGRVLPTPETVPFRLTRDIEDGMGVSGIEGVFRRACEKTMEVLRLNAETIITILEVLLYDPLYAWTITPAEAYSRQFTTDREGTTNPITFSDEDKINVNVTAERALLRLRQKLQGTEEGGTSSIEGQVDRLLQQARDPANLSRLFHGWQPYF